ncbi:MAG: hypothetical protein IT332_07655 [Ardenticatenales bacterium]|nr:hypothetical protein [Ardenticatenales bacterium]
MDQPRKDRRLRRLSLYPLTLDQAMRGALAAPPPKPDDVAPATDTDAPAADVATPAAKPRRKRAPKPDAPC